MNRTIKEASVQRHHYDSHDQLRRHLADYKFGRHLKTLKPYEAVCKHGSERHRFTSDPTHQILGPNI